MAVALAPATLCAAQYHHHRATQAAKAAAADVPVTMLSDVHFDPFHDPALFAQLRTAPVDQWPALLASPASATQAADFAALQSTCKARGVDTPYALLATSLRQASAVQGKPLFVTLTGDFLVHGFDCRFRALAPQTSADDLSAFAAKTVAFVTAQVRAAFPDSPVYFTLGNNDSGCTDYRETPGSAFLQSVGTSFAAAVHDGPSAQLVLRSFSQEGDYSLLLPAPMHATRLIVLQDIFQSSHFKSCGDKPDADASAQQIAWLQGELAAARTAHQRVWVMAHVPPGVDMYATVHAGLCSKRPVPFLGSEAMADTLTANSDVVALGLFAHTHADELRLLHAGGGLADHDVPVKFVASISPVNGNAPTFTEALVNAGTAELSDYAVYLVDQGLPNGAAKREYDFREIYREPAFNAAGVRAIVQGFGADKSGGAAMSMDYQRFSFPGDATGRVALAMRLLWPAYACSLHEDGAAAFTSCACPAKADGGQ